MLERRRPGPWRWWVVLAAIALGVVPVLVFRYLPRLWAWIVTATFIAIAFGWFPPFGVLGFELAPATTVLAAVMCADVGRSFARELQTMRTDGLDRAMWPGRALARGA